MERPDRLSLLDELLAAEQAMLAPRLLESMVYVCDADVKAHQLLSRLAASARRRAAALADLLIAFGGVPGPLRMDPATAALHFQELHAVWPELVKERRSIIDLYARVAPAIHVGAAASLLKSNQAEHASEFEAIQTVAPVLAGP